MQLSLMFFATSKDSLSTAGYRGVIESARFADRHGFSAVWVPERHFTEYGGLYPNPAVLHAALARETSSLRLRSGSVVVPLHDPLRIAEEWAMVDNLSGGRVEISFASGWNPDDFAFFPERYADRHGAMYRGIETVLKLWRGESVAARSGNGKAIEVSTYPRPVQRELPIWLTAAGNPKTFARAGEMGANLLTHMLDQDLEGVAERVAVYRRGRAEAGLDPARGQVAIMLHTFVGEDLETVREEVREPYCAYLRDNLHLLRGLSYSRGGDFDPGNLSEADRDELVGFLFDRFFASRALMGTPASCLPLLRDLAAVGVDEIACLLDFGPSIETILANLAHLDELRRRGAGISTADPIRAPYRVSAMAVEPAPAERPSAEPPPAEDSLAEIRARCDQRCEPLGLSNGCGIEELLRGAGEALGRVRLPSEQAARDEDYEIHPAVLDACFQALRACGSAPAPGEASWPLAGLESLRLLDRLADRVWSHARLRQGAGDTELRGDVRILDDAGRLLAEAAGVVLRPAEEAAGAADGWADGLYEQRWEPMPERRRPVDTERLDAEGLDAVGLDAVGLDAVGLDAVGLDAEGPGTWVLLCDAGDVGQCLAGLLEASGEHCVRVEPGPSFGFAHGTACLDPARGEHFARLLTELRAAPIPSCRGIIHLWSLDAAPPDALTVAGLETAEVLGTGSALRLIQALVASEDVSASPRLWLVTCGAQPVKPASESVAIAQAPIWGLGKTCAVEQPQLWGGLVDLDPAKPAAEAASGLAELIRAAAGEDQIALRGDRRFVPRLVRSSPGPPMEELAVRPDASYLIAGGLWGLGLEVARWLVSRGARHLVLLGRSPLPPAERWDELAEDSREARQVEALRALEREGAEILYAAVDITDKQALSAFREQLGQRPPIRGLVHAASVWVDPAGRSLMRPLDQLDDASLQQILRPKVTGGWLLYSSFAEEPLDFLAFFSSAASLLGSEGQGNYAAAGSFLDALAHHLRAAGRPAISFDWGPVSESGFGTTPEGLRVHEYWASRGIGRIAPAELLEALAALTPRSLAQIALMRIDWRRLLEFYPAIGKLPWAAHLAAEARQEAPARASDLLGRLARESAEVALELLIDHLRERVAVVLRLDPARGVDPGQGLFDMGMDSLMALELKSRLQADLGRPISTTAILNYPSIATLARYLTFEVLGLEPASAPGTAGRDGVVAGTTDTGTTDSANDIAELSDEEVEARLLAKLETL